MRHGIFLNHTERREEEMKMKVIEDLVGYLSKEKVLPIEFLEALFDQGLILDKRPLRRMLVSLIEEAARYGEIEPGSIARAAAFCVKYGLEACLDTYCRETKTSLGYAVEFDPECVPGIEKLLQAANFAMSEVERIEREREREKLLFLKKSWM